MNHSYCYDRWKECMQLSRLHAKAGLEAPSLHCLHRAHVFVSYPSSISWKIANSICARRVHNPFQNLKRIHCALGNSHSFGPPSNSGKANESSRTAGIPHIGQSLARRSSSSAWHEKANGVRRKDDGSQIVPQTLFENLQSSSIYLPGRTIVSFPLVVCLQQTVRTV